MAESHKVIVLLLLQIDKPETQILLQTSSIGISFGHKNQIFYPNMRCEINPICLTYHNFVIQISFSFTVVILINSEQLFSQYFYKDLFYSHKFSSVDKQLDRDGSAFWVSEARSSPLQDHCYLFFPGLGEVGFTFKGATLSNNSLVTSDDIGEGDDALRCMTDNTSCCRRPYTQNLGQSALGNWFFPNGTRVPSSGMQWDFHRTRAQSKVLLHRRRGGVNGVYHCAIHDTMNVTQSIYIGVYSADTGE